MVFLKKSAQTLLRHLYPSFCLMCRKPLATHQKICDICSHELELIDPIERCPRCFSQKSSCTAPCLYCFKHPVHYRVFGQACCLQESTLTNLLLRYLHHRVEWHLEMALAALAYVQFDRLRWPKPDFLFMEPSHWLLQNRKEHNLSKRLTRHFASLFKIPLLKTRLIPTSLSNPFLPLEEQPFSGSEEIVLSNKKPLHGKNILILTTTLKTGTTWKACSQSLELHGLSRIWNMGLIASELSWMHT